MDNLFVKASGITNLTDARYFAAKEVAYLGFCLEEGHPQYLDPSKMLALREWVQGPQIVGEFWQTPAATVREAANFYQLDAVQVPLALPNLAFLAPLPVLLHTSAAQLAISAAETAFSIIPTIKGLVIDVPETISSAALATLREVAKVYPVFLHTAAPLESLRSWVGSLRPVGLSIAGGTEERVGVKSFDDIEAIFDWLEGGLYGE